MDQGGGSCNDLPFNLYKRNFMDSAYNLKRKKHSRKTLTAEYMGARYEDLIV